MSVPWKPYSLPPQGVVIHIKSVEPFATGSELNQGINVVIQAIKPRFKEAIKQACRRLKSKVKFNTHTPFSA